MHGGIKSSWNLGQNLRGQHPYYPPKSRDSSERAEGPRFERSNKEYVMTRMSSCCEDPAYRRHIVGQLRRVGCASNYRPQAPVKPKF